MTTSNVMHVQDWTDEIFSVNRREKDPIKTDLDLLVLSCTLYRLRNAHYSEEERHKSNRFKMMSLTEESEIARHVSDLDYVKADNIREHFGQKLMMLALRNTPLTKFREDLNRFIHNDWHLSNQGKFQYPGDFLGLAYKLPYLYQYDCELSEVFDNDYHTIKGPNSLRGTKDLTFIRKLEPNRKHNTALEYWFSDESDNRAVVRIDTHNPLASLFESIIKNPVKINGKFEMRMKDTAKYYEVHAWECVV